MADEQSNKMTGRDVFICIDNTGATKSLTVGKPYRVISMCRDCIYELHIFIKNDNHRMMWYKNSLFRPQNDKD